MNRKGKRDILDNGSLYHMDANEGLKIKNKWSSNETTHELLSSFMAHFMGRASIAISLHY